MNIKVKLNKRFFWIFLSLSAVYLTVLITTTNLQIKLYYFFYPHEGIECYRQEGPSLQDISYLSPKKGKSIFFHETSCNSFKENKIVITARQACAVESAARTNPNFEVYLLFTSPGLIKDEGTESDRFLKALFSYSNVRINHLNYGKYTENSPVEELYKNGYIDYSNYAKSHASDVLRYLTLWKYGGIYLDLDVIVLRDLEGLGRNYAGAESDQNVAAGVMSFSSVGVGPHLAKSCLTDLEHHFSGKDWGNNGPGVITRLLKNLCGAQRAKDMLGKDCQGFKVYPPSYFYGVPWWNWTVYFDEKHLDYVQKMTKDSYVLHVWNKHSALSKIPTNSNIPYVRFAKEYCPKVFKECDQYF